MTRPDDLLAYCQLAQRAGASRGLAFERAYKLSAEAERLVHEADGLELWVHMGRVNSRKRFDYARAIGCDSVDGSSFSVWRDRWLPAALGWHRDHLQERIPA